MVSKKTRQKILKHRICLVARVIACVSFLVLTIIGVSSAVRAMSLETIANENGIPFSWQTASLGNPVTITIPITYWDQREDDCSDPNRQFEWTACRLYGKGIIRNVVRDQLGVDGLPVPTHANNIDAWSAYHDVFTANVTGDNPVQPTDNFYRWFHETYDETGKQLSKQYDREVIFHRTGNNSYEYGSKGTFPLDDVDFSDADPTTKQGHNFLFTAHMSIPMKIDADGSEQFWFSGDDDVWVFLNGQLVLDLGGLHTDTEGYFTIDKDGNIISTVNNVANQACRQTIINPLDIGYDAYNSQVENSCPRTPVTTTICTNFQPGDVVNLDFFYAERSTTESNTRINITNMNWPISADSNLNAEVVGRIGDTEHNLIQFISKISNRDPENPLEIERIAAYIEDQANSETNSGFLSLSSKTLYYTTDPDDKDSWQPVDISSPENSMNGFKLTTPLQLSKAGTTGDTLYFRYFGESSDLNGNMSSIISYYTSINGASGITYDSDSISYAFTPPVTPTDPEIPSEPETPVLPSIPDSDIIDDDLIYLGPLGEVAFVPNTGIISDAVTAVFEVGFAEIVLSQGFVMAMLLIFAGSFATYFSLRKFMNLEKVTSSHSASMKPRKSKSYAKTSKKTMPKPARATKNIKKR